MCQQVEARGLALLSTDEKEWAFWGDSGSLSTRTRKSRDPRNSGHRTRRFVTENSHASGTLRFQSSPGSALTQNQSPGHVKINLNDDFFISRDLLTWVDINCFCPITAVNSTWPDTNANTFIGYH